MQIVKLEIVKLLNSLFDDRERILEKSDQT